jgi:hypothetical protein
MTRRVDRERSILGTELEEPKLVARDGGVCRKRDPQIHRYMRLSILDIERLRKVKTSVCLMDESLAVICVSRRDEVTRVLSRVPVTTRL